MLKLVPVEVLDRDVDFAVEIPSGNILERPAAPIRELLAGCQLPRGCWRVGGVVVAWLSNRWWMIEGADLDAELARCGFGGPEIGGLPTPRYGVGQSCWLARSRHTTEDVNCIDCAGTGKWDVSSRGEDDMKLIGEVDCPRCRGCGKIKLPTRAADVELYTVRSIEVKSTRDPWGDGRVCYCSGESGGTIAYEWQMFDTREEAMAQAEVLAAEERDGLDKGPKRDARALLREVRCYNFRDAQVREAEEKASRVGYDYDYLREQIMNLLDEEYGLYILDGGVKDDEDFEEATRGASHPDKPTRELIVAWLMSGGLGNSDADYYLEAKAEKRKEDCSC